MSITVPDCLYGKANNFAHFKTTNLEVFQYHHLSSEVVNEVILNKNLLLFVNSGIKQLKICNEQTSISSLQGAFIPKGSYLMTENSSQSTQNGFESLLVLIEDDFFINFCNTRTTLPPTVAGQPKDYGSCETMSSWVKFSKSPFLDMATRSLNVFFDHPDQVSTLFLEEKIHEILHYLLAGDGSRQLLTHLNFIAVGSRNAKLRQFLDRHFMLPWTVEDFAKNFGLSVSTFKRECTNTFGMSPKRWINRRRLECAQQKLRNRDKSMTQISMELGFADSSHFSKTFRKHYNCSPSEYRSLKPAQVHSAPSA